MTRMIVCSMFVVTVFAACKSQDAGRSEPPSPGASARLTAMAICNKIASRGGATQCVPQSDVKSEPGSVGKIVGAATRSKDNGVDEALFVVKGSKAQNGIVLVLSPSKYRQALDMDWTAGGADILATSDALGALVTWSSGGEVVDARIRLGLLEAEAMNQ
jgi:hypothetical protein